MFQMSLPSYPYSNIFIGPTRTISVTGPHIHVIDNLTGEITSSTTFFSDNDKEEVLKSGPIACSTVDNQYHHLLTVGGDKKLKLWDVQSEELKLINTRELPKRPTSLMFTTDGKTLLVADKFGDVFSYPFEHDPSLSSGSSGKEKGKQKERDTTASHENPSGGTLILGHTSPLNAFLLTHDEKFIITADRDEHIRVSKFPKGYTIEMYCLGHLKFVSAIHIPPSATSLLISGGGDPVLKIWDWKAGICKHELRIWEVVEPFLAVKGVKRRRGWWVGEDGHGDEADGNEEDEATQTTKAKKGRRGKGNKAANAEEETTQPLTYERVLVISGIKSVRCDMDDWVVFSAVGSTALFGFPLSLEVTSNQIRHFDFGRPIVNFAVLENDKVVLTLDANWRDPEKSAEQVNSSQEKVVRVVKLSAGEISEDLDCHKKLVETLTTKALIQATAADLKKLELYTDLTSMPKFAIDSEESSSNFSTLIPTSTSVVPGLPLPDTSGSPGQVPIGAPEISSATLAKSKAKRQRPAEEGQLTKREMGRLKKKEAVLNKARQQADTTGAVDSEDPIPKKPRSELDHDSEVDADVEMVDS